MKKKVKKIFIIEIIILIIVVSLFSIYTIVKYNNNKSNGVFYANYKIEDNTLTFKYYAEEDTNEDNDYPYVFKVDITLNGKLLKTYLEGVGTTKRNAKNLFADNVRTDDKYLYQTIKDLKTNETYLVLLIPYYDSDLKDYYSNPVIYRLDGLEYHTIYTVKINDSHEKVIYHDSNKESKLNFYNHKAGENTHGLYYIEDNKIYNIDMINEKKLTGEIAALSIKNGALYRETIEKIKLEKIN